ncbi:uncharacterized protein MEPE_00089 [Melanopsichium pennsylvanicum]|uniref:Uncharacterized protein n=1 Tax=Melanopsichium pennsylvanicum TaxID=63383 RepID=A0AAJ4XF91_9BASI|nr:uncharacterized protein MEPE_00089 [Melanopsichium pennsylvanicum]
MIRIPASASAFGFESDLCELVRSALAASPKIGVILRDFLSHLARIPADTSIDDIDDEIGEELEVVAQVVLSQIRSRAQSLDRRLSSDEHLRQTWLSSTASDPTNINLFLHLFFS